jgi:multidrug resistance protein
MVGTVLPRIGESLHTTINWTGWTITVYQLGQILAAPISGRLSDQFSRKKVLLTGIVLFTFGSMMCGIAPNIGVLLGLRFVQSLGGGAFITSASGIIADNFGKDRDKAIGMFTSITPTGSIIGPVIGGVIAQYWNWRGIFFVNVPLGILLIVLTICFVPQGGTRKVQTFDVIGLVQLSMLLITGMFAITLLGQKGDGIGLDVGLVCAFVAVIMGYVFVKHTKRAVSPFVPKRLLMSREFAPINLINLLYGTVALGFSTMVPLYAENRYHISISHAGTVLSARGIGTILIAAVAAMMIRKTGYRLPMVAGFLTIAVSLAALALHPLFGLPPYWWLAIFALTAGLGIGVAAPATNNATLNLVPDQVAGVDGLRLMFRQSGGILYVSTATAYLARSVHPGLAQAHVFAIQAGILFVMIGLVFRVPDHKGSW